MAMSHRNPTRRGILTTTLLGLVLSGCSFSYSSGSSPSNSPNRSSGKPVSRAHAHTSSGKSDNRGKPISRSSSSDGGSGKSIPKGDDEPDAPTRVDADDDAPTRTPKADPPERTKNPPKRTKVPVTRTPVDGDTTDADTQTPGRRSPASNTTIRAKTKVDDPSASDNLVAPK